MTSQQNTAPPDPKSAAKGAGVVNSPAPAPDWGSIEIYQHTARQRADDVVRRNEGQ